MFLLDRNWTTCFSRVSYTRCAGDADIIATLHMEQKSFFATSRRQRIHLHRLCLPMGTRSESEGRMKACLSIFAILCPAQRGQNMMKFRPEKSWSKLRRKDSAWHACIRYSTFGWGAHTSQQSHTHPVHFYLFPPGDWLEDYHLPSGGRMPRVCGVVNHTPFEGRRSDWRKAKEGNKRSGRGGWEEQLLALAEEEGQVLGKEQLTPDNSRRGENLSAAGGDRETSLSLLRHQETFRD